MYVQSVLVLTPRYGLRSTVLGSSRSGETIAPTCGRERRKNVDRMALRDAHASTAHSDEAEWPSQPRHTPPRVNPEMPKRATHRLAALTRGPDTHTHHSGADSPRHTHAHTLTCSHGFSPVTLASRKSRASADVARRGVLTSTTRLFEYRLLRRSRHSAPEEVTPQRRGGAGRRLLQRVVFNIDSSLTAPTEHR